MDQRKPLNRRSFLQISGTAAGGLLVGWHLPACQVEGISQGPAARYALNAFIQIDTDNTITLTVPLPEMGQGVRTSLSMIVAEELAADWATVKIRQADLDEEAYGRQFAGGSTSVRRLWQPLRKAGATARAMLLQAAAQTWGVDPASCRTDQSVVTHTPTGRSLSYGALATTAATLPVPEDPPLKDIGSFTLIGKRTADLDAPKIIDGSIKFALDEKVPGMLYATVERSPVFGAQVRSYGAERAMAVPGVREVVSIDADAVGGRVIRPNMPNMLNGVAVVADSTWAALQGRTALSVTWDLGPEETESTASLRQQFMTRSQQSGEIVRDDGHVAQALQQAAKRLDAVYEVPFLAHVPMEPMNCLADARDDTCELWVPTQNPAYVRTAVAAALGITEEAVTVHLSRMGGGFGRRFYPDFAIEAATISKAVNAPVKVVWTREDDIRHDLFRPAGYHRMAAGLDQEGHLTAWFHHLVNTSRYTYLGRDRPPSGSELYPSDFPAEFIPNFRLEYVAAESSVPRGQWRAIAHSANVFVVQSFLDEIAHAAGQDLLTFMLKLLGEPREIPFFNRTYNSGRLRNVLILAAEKAGWGTPLPEGWGRGIAASYNQGSFVAEVAEVSVDDDGQLNVHRIVAAIDCGIVVNPSGVEQQVVGSIIEGLSAALYGEITVENGRVQQSNFHDYRLLRLHECPAIDVHMVPSTAPPSGTGEPPLPPVAPAVTNAIFDATGQRIRRLPISKTTLLSR